MRYQVRLSKKVTKEIEKIDFRFQSRIKLAIITLATDPYIGKSLQGELEGLWSYRVWPYRIIYKIFKNELVVFIVAVGHRKDIYK